MRSTVTDCSQFTIHNSLPFDANIMFAKRYVCRRKVRKRSFWWLVSFGRVFFFLIQYSFYLHRNKKKEYWCGVRGCTTPFFEIIPHPFPLSWICSTLTETRQKACGLVVSFRSLSGLTSCRPSANPPPSQRSIWRGTGRVVKILRFIQKPTVKRLWKFFWVSLCAAL